MTSVEAAIRVSEWTQDEAVVWYEMTVSVLCLGMKNCYVTMNLLVTHKDRLLHRKKNVKILFTSLKTLETHSFATLTSSFLKF